MIELAETKRCGSVHNILILDNELGMGGVEKPALFQAANLYPEVFCVNVYDELV